MKAFKTETIKAELSSYAGVIRCGYDVLAAAFGEPDPEALCSDGKVTCEWTMELEIKSGETIVFTIYNWKDKTPPAENDMWHVGSHHHNDPALFAFLGKTLRCDVITRG